MLRSPRRRQATVIGLSCGWLAIGAPADAEIRDVRANVARAGAAYRALHPDAVASLLEHGKSRHAVHQALGKPTQTPGGVGFGYYFYDTALLWTNFTVLDYYIITPRVLGADPSDYAYLTSTCRSQLGTESLIWYSDQNEASFWIFDWARQGNQWQAGINLPTDHPQYLTTAPDQFANTRPKCHIRNGTWFLGLVGGLYQWQNQVLLFNFSRADWDIIYTYNYTTTNLSDNLFQAVNNGSEVGHWGPIVETFGNYTNVNPIGFDLVRLFQDGDPNPHWLTTANSYPLQSEPFQLITQAPDTSFAVYAGSTNPDAFPITSVVAGAGTVLIGLNSLPGRNYSLYSSTKCAAGYAPTGLSQPGTGAPISFQVSSSGAPAYFRSVAGYNTGTLCVTANTNRGSFSIAPASGIISPYWVSTPSSNRWDKFVVGLPPGAYTVTFSGTPGLGTPPAQNVLITNQAITTVQAIYQF